MDIRIDSWAEGDLPLLQRLLGDPAMMVHLGGPETPEKIADRQRRYLADPLQRRVSVDGQAAGWVGIWPREHQGEDVWEIGWAVVPEMQGRGVAGAAVRLALELAAGLDGPRAVHAYPGVENAASNALCARAGFELIETLEFEYPPGSLMRCNDWRFALAAR